MVAIDAMGGDFAPHAICEGVIIAAKLGIPLTLFGPQDTLQRILGDLDPLWQSYAISIVHAPDVIEMGEEPVQAVRKKPNASLVLAVSSVKNGICSSVISAGSSGALMAAATLILGRAPGVERPAIAGLLPTALGQPVVALDLGACVECKPSYLYQFAHLGVAYAQQVLGIKIPRVGLLANGSEDSKGNALTKEVFNLLKESSLAFVGNVEPQDIAHHKIDVLVCDGFSGNILLKSMEATAEVVVGVFMQQVQLLEHESDRLVGKKLIKKIRESSVLADQGGAPLLGVQGTVIVAHGNSNAQTMARGIALAYKSSLADQVIGLNKLINTVLKKGELGL